MPDLLTQLSGGDRRSTGVANQIVSRILAGESSLTQIFDGLRSGDPILRMRCADVAEKVTAVKPELLLPHKRALLDEFSLIEQKEVRWHVAAMLARLPLSKREVAKVMKILQAYAADSSSIVKTMAMQAMADIGNKNPSLQAGICRQIEVLMLEGTPAMRARGRKLLARMTEQP